jgi:hypothetical protein
MREALVRTYGDTPDTRALAELAVEAWDRRLEARALVARDGLVLETAQGRVRHPALAVERDAAVTYLATLRALRAPRARSKPGRPPIGEQLAENPEVRFFPGSRHSPA